MLDSFAGTTATGLLAALTAEPSELEHTIQIALCHLYFNIIGILVFYPIPFMRWPIGMAKVFGRKVSKHRWFGPLYLLVGFFLLPVYVFGLSFAPPIVLYIGVIFPAVLVMVTILINVIQAYRPLLLPSVLQNWNFLPKWLRSLQPYDR